MKTFIVEFPSEWFLRGTTAAGSVERADRFKTREEAEAALKNAAKFMKRPAVKAAKIRELED